MLKIKKKRLYVLNLLTEGSAFVKFRAMNRILQYQDFRRFLQDFYDWKKRTSAFSWRDYSKMEILVVDEVLAVGDAEFQKKAIGKMQDVSKGEGRTVLFVSHNMTSVKALCNRGVILQNGMLVDDGEVDTVVTHYLRGDNDVDNYKTWSVPEIKKGGFELLEIGIRRKDGNYADVIRMDHELELVMRYRLTTPMDKFWITLHMKNEQGNKIFSFSGVGRCYDRYHEAGEYEQICHIPADFLNWGNYGVDFMAFNQVNNIEILANESDLISFSIANRQVAIGGYMGKEPGDVTPKFDFEERKLK